MTDPTLTDEELAEIERGHERTEPPFNTGGFCRRCSHFWPCPTFRLVTALQDERAENDRLAKRLSRYEQLSGRFES